MGTDEDGTAEAGWRHGVVSDTLLYSRNASFISTPLNIWADKSSLIETPSSDCYLIILVRILHFTVLIGIWSCTFHKKSFCQQVEGLNLRRLTNPGTIFSLKKKKKSKNADPHSLEETVHGWNLGSTSVTGRNFLTVKAASLSLTP